MLLHSSHSSQTDINGLSCRGSQQIHSSLFALLKMLLTPRSRKLIVEKNFDDVDDSEQSVLNPLALHHPSCIFCGASTETGFNVVWENDDYTVFTDINPSAEHHLQIVPKRHIESVKTLRSSDAAMVKAMMAIGHEILDTLDVPPNLRRLGFHIPPYISVPHLHMHVQALPYRSLLRRLKYPIISGRKGHEKGFSWFADAEQTIRLLEKGVHVRILPC